MYSLADLRELRSQLQLFEDMPQTITATELDIDTHHSRSKKNFGSFA